MSASRRQVAFTHQHSKSSTRLSGSLSAVERQPAEARQLPSRGSSGAENLEQKASDILDVFDSESEAEHLALEWTRAWVDNQGRRKETGVPTTIPHQPGSPQFGSYVRQNICCDPAKFARYRNCPPRLLAGSSPMDGPPLRAFFLRPRQSRSRIGNRIGLCEECTRLQGCFADNVRENFGQCGGAVAIEHYRCEKCRSFKVR
ncbi:hypothetical protein GCT13_01020 [Paraburkholderia sp. CNPSo 3157]|uniref:Uncharacterized protein n=1 Tax=Paraburkholderia franconis TaxID=2654983 RepID=A0A7X1N5Q9_9BURK|nr:hypothetical protein [Paraburkholderia franconis]